MEINRKQQKFIDSYVHKQDPALAAIHAGYNKNYGLKLYAMPEIRAEIDRKLGIVFEKKAEIIAADQVITKAILDRELHNVITADVYEVGKVKLDGIEMGYRRVGMMALGEFVKEPDPNEPKIAPNIFRAEVQRTLTHTIIEQETVTKTLEVDPWA